MPDTLDRAPLTPGSTGLTGVVACVLTYNRAAILLRCLAAIRAQSHPVDRIVIFDNGSTDGTETTIAAAGLLDDARVTFVRADRNLGPAAGLHALMRRAYDDGADWLWVMDDDVLPAPDALAELALAFNAAIGDPGALGFLVSRVVTPDGRPNNVPDIDNRQDHAAPPRWTDLLHHGLVRVAWATFNSVLFPRSALREFGFPLPAFFYGGEDIDLTIRIARARPSYIVGRSLAVHLRDSSGTFHPAKETDRGRIPLYFYYYRNQVYLRRAHMSRKALALFLFGVLRDMLRVAKDGRHRWAMLRVMATGAAAGMLFAPRREGSTGGEA